MSRMEKMKQMNWDQCLYLIADFSYGEDKIYEALRAGVDVIQLREKDISSAEYLRLAMRLREMTRETNTIFIVNDRLDLALLSEADGVHLGASDVPVAQARALLGEDYIIGATAKTVEQAKLAGESGADYIGSGAWAKTTTKTDAVPISEEVYREILAVSGLKNVAVGGITVENCARPLSCGAAGLAVSAGILKGDIRANIAGFREKMKEACR
ncbi:MAG: thiamine phosphate synthase [bacterium]|nr:thiamine phosphate synthase [bacterium]